MHQYLRILTWMETSLERCYGWWSPKCISKIRIDCFCLFSSKTANTRRPVNILWIKSSQLSLSITLCAKTAALLKYHDCSMYAIILLWLNLPIKIQVQFSVWTLAWFEIVACVANSIILSRFIHPLQQSICYLRWIIKPSNLLNYYDVILTDNLK